MSTSKQIAVFCALAFSAVVLNASAGVGKGDFEAGANLSITNTSATVNGTSTPDTTFGNIGASFGYFVLDFLEIKAAVSTTVTEDLTQGVFSPGADFVFWGQKSVAPFVGAAYGLSFGDTPPGAVDSDFIDAHAGIKFFINERTSLEVKLTKFEPMDSAATNGSTQLAVGINIYF